MLKNEREKGTNDRQYYYIDSLQYQWTRFVFLVEIYQWKYNTDEKECYKDYAPPWK